MEIEFDIVYERTVVEHDIPQLTPVWRNKIRNAIEEKLTTHPEVFGKPLRQSLRGYRKLRVGDYRIVFRITDTKVLVFAILHRSVVYTEANKRLSS